MPFCGNCPAADAGPSSDGARHTVAGSRRALPAGGDELQFIVFRIGAQPFAVNIFQVARILRYEQPAGADLEGAIEYAGRRVPLIDLRRRLGLPAEVHEETRTMVLEFDRDPAGVIVDQVHEALKVDTSRIVMPAPATPGVPAEWLTGAITRGDRTILVVNPARLLASTEPQGTTGGHP